MKIACNMCGACCIAYDISSLQKPAGVPCMHLGDDGACKDYANRPQVCRDFQADELCELISILPLSQKIRIIQEVYS
jgi:Fe-S-cluster containining protein